MCANSGISICEILTTLAACASVIASVWVHRSTLRRSKKLETIKKLSKLRDDYPELDELTYEEKFNYLKELEFFCTGINEKIYDIHILKKMSGKLFLSQYRNVMRDFIAERRSQSSTAKNAWKEYEAVIMKLSDMYDCECPNCP